MKKVMYVAMIFTLMLFALPEKAEKDLAIEKGCKTRVLSDGTIVKYGMSCTGPLVIRPE